MTTTSVVMVGELTPGMTWLHPFDADPRLITHVSTLPYQMVRVEWLDTRDGRHVEHRLADSAITVQWNGGVHPPQA